MVRHLSGVGLELVLGPTLPAPTACLGRIWPAYLYGLGVATDEELEGQTSIEEALADLGEPWTAEEDDLTGWGAGTRAPEGCETPTLF